MERSYSRVPPQNREAFRATQLAAVSCRWRSPRTASHPYLGCRGFSAFAVPSVLHPTTSRILASSITGSGGSGGALNGAIPSSSFSSDSQDSMGVSHGFLSLGPDLRAGSVRVSLRNISSSSRDTPSRDTPSRAPSLFQHHGSILDFVHKFSFHHSDMPELSLHSCVQEKIRAMNGKDRNSTVTTFRETVRKFNETQKGLALRTHRSEIVFVHAWDVRQRAKSKLALKRGAPLP